jgi:hypothetical protein
MGAWPPSLVLFVYVQRVVMMPLIPDIQLGIMGSLNFFVGDLTSSSSPAFSLSSSFVVPVSVRVIKKSLIGTSPRELLSFLIQ